MATGKRGGGTGSHTANGVCSTMKAPFGKAANSTTGTGPGIDNRNKAPFDKPKAMGGGGIPERFYDTGMKAKVPGSSSAGASSVIGITKRNPSARRFQNPK